MLNLTTKPNQSLDAIIVYTLFGRATAQFIASQESEARQEPGSVSGKALIFITLLDTPIAINAERMINEAINNAWQTIGAKYIDDTSADIYESYVAEFETLNTGYTNYFCWVTWSAQTTPPEPSKGYRDEVNDTWRY